MFDLGLSKMALIGVVALVVLGPERLPRVARTAGALLGRAQRYVNDVKSEVAREIELDGLRTMKSDFEAAAHNVEKTIQDNVREHTSTVTDAWKSTVGVVTAETGLSGGGTPEAGTHEAGTPDGDTAYGGTTSYGGVSSGADGQHLRDAAAASAPKRRNWRVRQAAMPVWYKRATTRRTHVQSGAARVARGRPANPRRPTRFL